MRCAGFRVGPKSSDQYPYKRKRGGFNRREETPVVTEAETGAALPQSQECRESLEAGFSPRASREPGAAKALISKRRPPELRENTFLMFYATKFVVICNGSPRNLMQ